MKKALLTIAAIVSAAQIGLIYPATMEVIDIQEETAILETATGHIYEIGAEDYEIGDFVSMILYSNGTENVTDDIVIASRFSGYAK